MRLLTQQVKQTISQVMLKLKWSPWASGEGCRWRRKLASELGHTANFEGTDRTLPRSQMVSKVDLSELGC